MRLMTLVLSASLLSAAGCDRLGSMRQSSGNRSPAVTLAERVACNNAIEKSWAANPAIEPGIVGHGSLATGDGHCLLWWDSTDVARGHDRFTFQIEDVFSRETLASGSTHCSWKDPDNIGKGCEESPQSGCEFRHETMACPKVQERVRAEWPELYEVVTGVEKWVK